MRPARPLQPPNRHGCRTHVRSHVCNLTERPSQTRTHRWCRARARTRPWRAPRRQRRRSRRRWTSCRPRCRSWRPAAARSSGTSPTSSRCAGDAGVLWAHVCRVCAPASKHARAARACVHIGSEPALQQLRKPLTCVTAYATSRAAAAAPGGGGRGPRRAGGARAGAAGRRGRGHGAGGGGRVGGQVQPPQGALQGEHRAAARLGFGF